MSKSGADHPHLNKVGLPVVNAALKEPNKKSQITVLVAGACGGCLDALITMPLDTVKTYCQVNPGNLSMMGGARQIVANKGAAGFYFGLPAMIAQVSFKASIRFFAFENIKRAMQSNLDPEGNNTTMINLGAGLGAGMTEAMVWTAPTERLKVLRQNDINSVKPKYNGLIGGMRTVIAEQGVAGLYAGVVPTAIRQASSVAVRFMLYAEFKKAIAPDGNIQPWQQLICGAGTGVASTLLNNPIDVVKSRLQAQEGSNVKYKGTVDCLMKTTREEGVAALYRGTIPRMMKVSAGQALTFATYDILSEFIQKRIEGS